MLLLKPTAPLCNSQHLIENTTWPAVTITHVYCTTIAYILCTTVYSIYGTMWCIYRRSGFDCEILLIANCEFFHNSQSKESQEKEYAINNNNFIARLAIRNH